MNGVDEPPDPLPARNPLHHVCEIGDVAEGSGLRVEVAGRALALFKVKGAIYAIDASCTHGPGSLSEGVLDGYEIECDFHQGCFDIRTGAVTAPPCMVPVTVYEVEIVDGRVMVRLG